MINSPFCSDLRCSSVNDVAKLLPLAKIKYRSGNWLPALIWQMICIKRFVIVGGNRQHGGINFVWLVNRKIGMVSWIEERFFITNCIQTIVQGIRILQGISHLQLDVARIAIMPCWINKGKTSTSCGSCLVNPEVIDLPIQSVIAAVNVILAFIHG